MCVIAVQPKGNPTLSEDILSNCWWNNPHGAGYMFTSGGVLTIRKPFFKLKDLISAYVSDHRQHGHSSPFVLHFRWMTHGKKNELNTHPHVLADGEVGLVHNGVLDFDPPSTKISDTVFFCRTVLAKRAASQLVGKKFNALLGEMIGKHNKFVLMDGNGKLSIVNEKQGLYDNRVWWSNNTYKNSRYIFDDDDDYCVGSFGNVKQTSTSKEGSGRCFDKYSKEENEAYWSNRIDPTTDDADLQDWLAAKAEADYRERLLDMEFGRALDKD